MTPPRVALVTGTLAEPAVRDVARLLIEQGLAQAHVVVLPIQVAALMTPDWVARKLHLDAGMAVDRVVLPGYCKGDLGAVQEAVGVTVERGPQSLVDLPQYFGHQGSPPGLGTWDIQIIAEINHASRLERAEILEQARALARDGADVIDIGCDPHGQRDPWRQVGQAVAMLRGEGLRVSIDSFQTQEVEAACRAGAELVLSVNSTNVDAAGDWGAEVVAIPDDPQDLASLDATMAKLDAAGVRFRVDPIIEPIGLGFAASLGRYLAVRRRYPQVAMMMGVGNLTELTEVDSAGVNMLLAGFCQEAGIHSVLTTQVINWARSSVRELDVARRLVHYAAEHRMPPKHLDGRLVQLRDPRLAKLDPQFLADLASKLTDRNVRLFADPQRDVIHAMLKGIHVQGDDPFELFDHLDVEDPSHAFYLGYEMAKAVIALTLHKRYEQDQALDFGLLKREERSHHERRRKRR